MRVGGWSGGASPGSKSFAITVTTGTGVVVNICPTRSGRSKVTFSVVGGDIIIGPTAASAIAGYGETLSPGGAFVLESTADVFANVPAGVVVTAREIFA